jgi:hypothetical protein
VRTRAECVCSVYALVCDAICFGRGGHNKSDTRRNSLIGQSVWLFGVGQHAIEFDTVTANLNQSGVWKSYSDTVRLYSNNSREYKVNAKPLLTAFVLLCFWCVGSITVIIILWF